MANARLKHAMIDAGDMKVPQLAKEVGVHQSNMYAIVNGAVPHLRTAQRIVRVLKERGVDVTIDDLWPDEKEAPAE